MPLAKRSEKGLLTPDNSLLAMIDLQPQMLFGVANFDRQTVINNNVMLAKAAKVFGVPFVLSSVETKGFSGNTWPQILSIFPNHKPIERTTMNCGTTLLRRRHPEDRQEEDRAERAVDRDPRRCRRSRRSTTATRSMSWRIAAAT